MSESVEWSDTALFSSAGDDGEGSDEWATPREYWGPIGRALGGFDLDAATSPDAPHKIAPVGFTEDDDALAKRWDIHGPDGDVDAWLNPPYSLSEDFLEHARDEYLKRDGLRSITVLIPVRTDTGYYHEVIDDVALEVAVGQGRIEFIPMGEQQSSGNTFPSMYLFFGPDELAEELLPVFETLGKPKRPIASTGPEQVGLEGWSQ